MIKHYEIGQTFPLDRRRGVQSGHTEPCWFALTTWPTKEPSALHWLNRQGVECWFPTETAFRNVGRGKKKRIEYERRLAPGYIFARFTQEPHWDILFCDTPGRLYLRGVVGIHSQPMPITEEILAEMQSVPERIKLIREREREAKVIRPGDKAEIQDGPLVGFVVDIQYVDAGIAHFITPLLGGKGSVEIHKIDKLVCPEI